MLPHDSVVHRIISCGVRRLSLLCHLDLQAVFAVSIGATLLLEDALIDTSHRHRKGLLYSQSCSFAGKPLVVQSNSAAILSHAVEFFIPRIDAGNPSNAVPVITLIASSEQGHENHDAPWFRGRGYFAVARFTGADS